MEIIPGGGDPGRPEESCDGEGMFVLGWCWFFICAHISCIPKSYCISSPCFFASIIAFWLLTAAGAFLARPLFPVKVILPLTARSVVNNNNNNIMKIGLVDIKSCCLNCSLTYYCFNSSLYIYIYYNI